MPTLTVHNAEIRTATVEVKTLTLSGKQVTQSVFKQLHERDLITADGFLNGQPWGLVNYHPDKCADAPAHVHVVWQCGSDLFRSRVEPRKTWPSTIEARNGERYLNAKARDTLRAGDDMGRSNAILIEDIQGVRVRIDPSQEINHAIFRRQQLDDYRAIMVRLGPDTRTDFLASRSRGRPDTIVISLSAAVRAAVFEFDEALAALGVEPLDVVTSYLHEEVRVEAGLRCRHSDVRKALLDLPQLFIAV